MATLSTSYPTLLSISKTIGPDGQVAKVAEIMQNYNEFVSLIPWYEANDYNNARVSARTEKPTAASRKLNVGFAAGASHYEQLDFPIIQLGSQSRIDVDVVNSSGNPAQARYTEDLGHIQSMTDAFSTMFFYGDPSTDPDAFKGLSSFYNDQSGNAGGNIITSAATPDSTDNSSLWLLTLGPDAIYGVYPKGSSGGLQVEDSGVLMLPDSSGTKLMNQYVTTFKWNCGIVIKNWRYAVRINIDAEDLISTAATGPDLIDLISDGIMRLPVGIMGQQVICANATVMGWLNKQMSRRVAANLTLDTVMGRPGPRMFFNGIPVVRCDAITSSESGL